MRKRGEGKEEVEEEEEEEGERRMSREGEEDMM